MVVKKRIYYGGFHGLIAPVVPKAPRSLRKRSFPTKPSKGGEICAIELLAAVAGKLLQESESSTSSTASKQKEQINIHKENDKLEPLEVKVKHVASELHDHGSGTESQLISQPTNVDLLLKKFPHSDNDSTLDHTSTFINSDVIQKLGTNSKIETSEDKNRVNDTPTESQLGGQHTNLEALAALKTYGLKDEVESCVNNRVLKKSSSRVHMSFYSDHVARHRGNMKIDIRDDDEKYFRYNPYSTKRRAFGSRSRAGYKRIRNILTSRYRKVAPKPKDYGSEVRSFYHKRKNIYMREQYQEDKKRRKSFHHGSKTTNTKDSHVKLSIKSFKVPELYVEVPETATVGSLKRSVMEAITAILQGQLHVGVLVQGKKIRDDNITLEQTGISKKGNLESLGFTLEPNSPEPPSSPIHKETPLLIPSSTPSSPIMENNIEKNQENVNALMDEQVADSKAIVVVQEAVDPEILSMVPLSEKPNKRYELSQRRTRRPFSVSEVEALVEAVETLGAGRWRDVKMRAFDDANHRTYVDLKDKWKTLVHTASISPQQRRGEPVPQDLLDRVLAAHAYWSTHQSKHQKTTM